MTKDSKDLHPEPFTEAERAALAKWWVGEKVNHLQAANRGPEEQAVVEERQRAWARTAPEPIVQSIHRGHRKAVEDTRGTLDAARALSGVKVGEMTAKRPAVAEDERGR